MKRRKIIILTISIIIFLSNFDYVSCFDYGKYKNFSLNEIVEKIKKHGDSHEGGYDFYLEHYKVQINLKGYPKEISYETATILNFFFKAFGIDKQYQELFTYELDIDHNGQKVTFVFQGQLIPFLKKEIKINDLVDLYVIFGIYDISEKRSIMLVNEFNLVKQSTLKDATDMNSQ